MTTEHMVEESKRVALMLTKRHLERALNELEWLSNSASTGDARNCICDANIHALSCKAALEGVSMLDTPYKVRAALPELIGALEDCAKISNEMVQTLIKGPDSGRDIFYAHQRLYDTIQLLKRML